MAPRMPEIALNPVKMKCRKDCPNRAYDCHCKCEKYASSRAECDKEIKRRALKRDVDYAIGDAMKRMPGKRGI